MLFEIKLPVHKKTFAAGATIIFTHPVVNSGNAYRTDLGIFEPPVNGTYSISATICTYLDTWMLIGLMKDETVMDEVIVGDPTWHQCGTSAINTYVTTANKVWVKVLQTNKGVINCYKGISSFKGVLLSTSMP